MDAILVDSTQISLTFPQDATESVRRESVVDTVLHLIDDQGADVVLVEGADGSGKTTLLAQVAMRTAEAGLSLFIRPLSSLATDPHYLMADLANQARYILFGEMRHEVQVPEAEFRTLISSLQTKARRQGPGGRIVIVVDGLEEFSEAQSALRDDIVWKVLPFGRQGFKFVVSGDASVLPDELLSKLEVRHCPVQLFSLPEARELFEDLDLESSVIEAIYRESRQMPGLMASFVREIRSGRKAEELLKDAPKDLKGYVAREWASIDLDGQLGALAGLVAFALWPYTIADAARVLGEQVEGVNSLLERIPTLRVSPITGTLEYVTEEHRKHARQLLSTRRSDILGLIIGDLQESSDPKRREQLVAYYRVEGRNEDVVAATSGDFLVDRLEAAESFLPVLRHARDGLDSALHIGDYTDIFRLSLLCSTLLGLDSSAGLKAHVDALAVLGEIDEAIALAQSAPILEDRAASLAAVCSLLKKRDPSRFEELRVDLESQFERLLQSDAEISRQRLIDLVASSLDVSPEYAYRFVERQEVGEARAQAMEGSQDGSRLEGETVPEAGEDGLTPSDSQETTRAILRTVTQFSSGRDAKGVFHLVADLAPDRQLFFLLRWLEGSSDREDALDVVEKALELIASTSDYVSTLRDFDLMAAALAEQASSQSARVSTLLKRIAGLSTIARERSKTADVVRLELSLFKVEMNQVPTGSGLSRDAVDRLGRVVRDIVGMHDVPTRSHCLALTLAALLDQLESRRLEAIPLQVVVREVSHRLEMAVDEVVNSTANHFDLLRNTLQALARADSAKAVGIVERINTEYRRNLGFVEIGTQILEGSNKGLSLEEILGVLDRVSSAILRQRETMLILEELADRPGPLPSDVDLALPRRFQDMRGWERPGFAARALAASSQLLHRIGSGASQKVANWAADKVSSIAIPSERIAVGYIVAKALAKCAPDVARAVLDGSDELQREDPTAAAAPQFSLITLAAISIRAFEGLLTRKAIPAEALEQVIGLVSLVSAQVDKLSLMARLVTTCYRADDQGLASAIAEEHIIPHLHKLPSDDPYANVASTITILPALYVTHNAVATDLLESLPLLARGQAVEDISSFLFYRVSPGEPISWRSPEFIRLDYSTALQIVSVLSHSTSDEQMARYARLICLSATKLRGGPIITAEQRHTLAERIEVLAEQKVPSPGGIQHEGYSVFIAGMAAGLRVAGGHVWDSLASRARSIPNVSDRAYVLASLAEVMPNRLSALRKELLKEARDETSRIGSVLDALDRYESVGQAARRTDSEISQACITSAIEMVERGVSGPVDAHLRSILDLAHVISPRLAERLAAQLDGDPARNRSTAFSFGEHIAVSKARDDLSDSRRTADPGHLPIKKVVKIANSHLADLNGRILRPIASDRASPYVSRAGSAALNRVASVYAWAVQNESLSPSGKVEPLRSALSSCEVAATLVQGVARVSIASGERSREAAKRVIGKSGGLIAGPGSREKVIEKVREFARSKVGSYLKVADPYFGPDELFMLSVILEERPDCYIQVLTSAYHQKEKGVSGDIASYYRSYWRNNVAGGAIPDIDICVAGYGPQGKSPIHDRWLLSEDAGLRFGTSIHSMGNVAVSEISSIDEERVAELTREFDSFTTRTVRELDGKRISMSVFSLQEDD